jgi:hypothetical protein
MMEWILLLAAGGGAAYIARRIRTQRQDRRARARQEAIELAQVQRLADEDVTAFGEELSRLDREIGEHALDEATRVDYQRALDAYESAQRTVPAMTSAGEVSRVTDTLATGRYALACVRARVEGSPVPERRAVLLQPPAWSELARRHVDAAGQRHPAGSGMRAGRREGRRPPEA